MDAYMNHVFNTSVQDVFHEFKRGFFQMCDRDLVKLFPPKELQEVLVGKDFHDWAKLKQVKSNKKKKKAPRGLVFSATATDLSHSYVLYLNTTNDYKMI